MSQSGNQLDAFLLGYIFGAAGQSSDYFENHIDTIDESEESKMAASVIENSIADDDRTALWCLAAGAIQLLDKAVYSDIHFDVKDVVRTSESVAESYNSVSLRE